MPSTKHKRTSTLCRGCRECPSSTPPLKPTRLPKQARESSKFVLSFFPHARKDYAHLTVGQYGAEMVESSVKTISRPVMDRLDARLTNVMDDWGCRTLDRVGVRPLSFLLVPLSIAHPIPMSSYPPPAHPPSNSHSRPNDTAPTRPPPLPPRTTKSKTMSEPSKNRQSKASFPSLPTGRTPLSLCSINPLPALNNSLSSCPNRQRRWKGRGCGPRCWSRRG